MELAQSMPQDPVCNLCNKHTSHLFDFGGILMCNECKQVQFDVSMKFAYNIPYKNPDHIYGNIYLGGVNSTINSVEMKKLNIQYVLVAAIGAKAMFPKDFKYLSMDIDDCVEEDLSKFVESAYQFISKACGDNKNILVHCLGGISRSASLIIYYLMHYYYVSFEVAFILVNERRHNIYPNSGFKAYLRSLNSNILKSALPTSVTSDIIKANSEIYDKIMGNGYAIDKKINKSLINVIEFTNDFGKELNIISISKEQSNNLQNYFTDIINDRLKNGSVIELAIGNQEASTIDKIFIAIVDAIEKVKSQGANITKVVIKANQPYIIGSLFGLFILTTT